MSRLHAEAEGLTLLAADNKTGYFGVYLNSPGYPKPYTAQVRRGGKLMTLGFFATAEEAALCVARSPEGQEAAKQAAAMGKVAANRPLTSEEEAPRRVVTKVWNCQAAEDPDDDVMAWLQTAIPWAYGFTC